VEDGPPDDLPRPDPGVVDHAAGDADAPVMRE
jgi:hypothetical protein